MTPVYAKGNRKTIKRLKTLLRIAKKDKAIHVVNRILGIILSIEKHRTSYIADALQVDRTTVPLWIYKWNNYKEEGLLEGYRSGRNIKLSKENFQVLYDVVDSGPIAYGLNTGVWTSELIANIIKEEFDIEYHPGHVRKILKKLRFSVQRPTTKLINGDPEKKAKWVRYTYPNLKKKPKRKKP